MNYRDLEWVNTLSTENRRLKRENEALRKENETHKRSTQRRNINGELLPSPFAVFESEYVAG